MEWLILAVFCAALVICIAFNIPILFALGFGLVLFFVYGKVKGCTWKELGLAVLKGVWTVRNILLTFLLIGILTAFWRASGTIPVIVCYASKLIHPSVFLIMTFLLCCAVSALTGTSFGTAATMGVICASMGNAMGLSPILTGGAILAGAFFGDRCSPVSTSALLVAAVTKTNIYDNIRRMIKSALIPFLISCGIYITAGFLFRGAGSGPDLFALFGRAFRLHWTALIPAAVILILAVFRVDVKISMAASILAAGVICITLQGITITELLRTALLGFTPADPEVAAMAGGGGIISMLRVAGIVCLSSSYSGLFEKTGLLDGVRRVVSRVSAKTTPVTAMALTSLATGMIACNQTLTILLTDQLCKGASSDTEGADPVPDSQDDDGTSDAGQFALDLEDTAVVIPPLIPWSIAGAVPLTSVGAPAAAILFACYLYILPLWRVMCSLVQKSRKRTAEI